MFLGSHGSWNSLWNGSNNTVTSASSVSPQPEITHKHDNSSSDLVSPGIVDTPSRDNTTEKCSPSPPKLFVLGTSDQFTAVSTLQALVSASIGGKDAKLNVSTSCMPRYLTPQAPVSGSKQAVDSGTTSWALGPNVVEMQVMQGCDHFFNGRQGEVAGLVMEWVRKHLC